MNLKQIRWQRWLAGAAVLLVAYAAFGFLLVPVLVKHQVTRFAQSEVARQASVGAVGFNPFTLRMEAQDIRLQEANGTPLFAIGKLAVQLQWRSLLRGAWSFAEIRVTAPSVNLLIAPDGKFNIAELLATLRRRPAAGPTDTLPGVSVERLLLEQGQVDLQDRRAGYANRFAPIDFTLTNFSTLPNQKDSYTLSAQSARGGKLRWKGQASVNPIRASGEVIVENASLPELGAYLKSHTRATLAAGQLSATLPYALSYDAGRLQASLAGASVALRELALAREGVTDSFATLTRLDLSGIDADLVGREATVGEIRATGGTLRVQRDAKGQLDLASLMLAATGLTTPALPVVNNWKLAVKQVVFDEVALNGIDETVSPPLRVVADKLRLQMQLAAAQTGPALQLTLANVAFSASGLSLSSGAQTPFKLAQLGLSDGALDLAARRVSVGRVVAESGQMQLSRDREGKLSVMGWLPRMGTAGGPAAPTPAGTPATPASASPQPWQTSVKTVELSQFGAELSDQGSGIKLNVSELAAKFDGASSDLTQPVRFNAGLKLREGGQLSAQGSVVPASGTVQADLRLTQLALAPLQPLLAQHLKLKIGGGSVSAQGRLTSAAGPAKGASLRYVGGFELAGLTLNEEDGDLFAAWKSVGTEKLTASLGPNLLEIPELRVVGANATLIIENDRSLNATRLLVRPAAGGAKPPLAPATVTAAANDPFPVRIGRVRLQDAKLDFTDLSLRPQFGAKIYELNGLVNGLSTNRDSRSRIELDGRVDEFGSARVRGDLNPFAPANNTDLNVVFRNVDMVAASPYTMKFAGYRIAEGRISLDLQYKLRRSQLEGTNQIVIDKLRLGDRVDSPDALKLPLEFAIALLKDSDGRIDLGLPVSGNLDDPQFNYGALIGKAVGNVLSAIVTAPFRALGRLLGGGGSGGGEKLEAIEFDPGSDRLLPPEREKLKQVAQILAKREQLKLLVPAQYSEAADGPALKTRAVRSEIARRTGIKLQPTEEPGPVDLGNDAVQAALRAMVAERFSDGAAGPQQKAGGSEPPAAEAALFYTGLLERLDQAQPLAADELSRLGTQRSVAITAALNEAGVDAARVAAAAPGKVDSAAGKLVPLKLGLAAK